MSCLCVCRGMIGAMPAVAVRHERRRQEKRSKRPSQLYLGGPWFPPASQSPTPSPGNNGMYSGEEGLPEYYVCGKVNINSYYFLELFYSSRGKHRRINIKMGQVSNICKLILKFSFSMYVRDVRHEKVLLTFQERIVRYLF